MHTLAMSRFFFLVLAAIIFLQAENSAMASTLSLTLATSRSVYELGSLVIVEGNLTMDGAKVNDGLVTFEIRDSRGEMILLRTCNTGTDPPRPWDVEIVEFYPCYRSGDARQSINAGGYLGFKMKLRSIALVPLHGIAVVSMQWSNGIPFEAFVMYEADLDPQSEVTFISWGLELPTDAPLGIASIYASALNGLPSTSGGYAYSPENASSILITESNRAAQTAGTIPSSTTNSSCSISFLTSVHGGALGQYTVYGSSAYDASVTGAVKLFTVRLTTDITGLGGNLDGRVDIMDLAVVSGAFGSYPNHPKWKPQADINDDERIDITDVAMVSADFGKYGTLP